RRREALVVAAAPAAQLPRGPSATGPLDAPSQGEAPREPHAQAGALCGSRRELRQAGGAGGADRVRLARALDEDERLERRGAEAAASHGARDERPPRGDACDGRDDAAGARDEEGAVEGARCVRREGARRPRLRLGGKGCSLRGDGGGEGGAGERRGSGEQAGDRSPSLGDRQGGYGEGAVRSVPHTGDLSVARGKPREPCRSGPAAGARSSRRRSTSTP